MPVAQDEKVNILPACLGAPTAAPLACPNSTDSGVFTVAAIPGGTCPSVTVVPATPSGLGVTSFTFQNILVPTAGCTELFTVTANRLPATAAGMTPGGAKIASTSSESSVTDAGGETTLGPGPLTVTQATPTGMPTIAGGAWVPIFRLA